MDQLPSGKEPAEGSRETIDREIERTGAQRPLRTGRSEVAPGDEAPPGTPGTGENACLACAGSGTVGDSDCSNWMGSGRVIKAIGGA
jgi:hypothetical protein